MMNRYPAIAVIEFSSIAKGILAADTMVKCAPITILKSGTVHNGKYLILIGGSVASVEESYYRGLSISKEQIIDNVFLPDVHDQVHDAILGIRQKCCGDAIAVFETGTVAAIVKSSDAGIKAAHVDIVEIRLADDLGGKGLTIFTGKIEEVETAIKSAIENLTIPQLEYHDILIPNLHSFMAQQIEKSTRFSEINLDRIEGWEL
jgi:microcompartment protein CcmL/EutN